MGRHYLMVVECEVVPAPAVVVLRTGHGPAVGSLAEVSAQEISPARRDARNLVHLTVPDTAWCDIIAAVATPPPLQLKRPKDPAWLYAQQYNTTGTTGPEGRCPADAFAALDSVKLAVTLNATDVYLSPMPQGARRYWVMDELRTYRAGETVDFMGVAATWVGAVPPEQMRKAVSAPYEETEAHLESRFAYRKGSLVFLLHSPAGKTWVMQSYTTEVDAELSLEGLPELGSKLNLPAGWSFEAKRLTRT
jgi:hypothetical protein